MSWLTSIFGFLSSLLGYVGRNEMVEKFERVQQHKREVERGKIHPSPHFMSEAEWLQTLDRLCESYNQARQDGKMTGGFSPEDAFARFDDAGDPPTKLDASCRYLLAHHKRPMRVTRNGITLPQSFGGFTYSNEQTGRLVGQSVLVFFNPELPEIITVTDMERRNPFSVAARNSVPAMDAPEETLAAELANIESHQRYAKERYRVLKLKYQRPFRRNVVAARVMELGESIREQTATAQVEHRRIEQLHRKARRVAQQTGLPASGFRRVEQLEAAEELLHLLNVPAESRND